jgi:hypothetical protein
MILKTKDFGGYKTFKEIIKRMLHCTELESSRYNHDFKGVFCELKKDATMLRASDGQILIDEVFNIKNDSEGNFVLPKPVLLKLMKIENDYTIKIEITETDVKAVVGESVFYLQEGKKHRLYNRALFPYSSPLTPFKESVLLEKMKISGKYLEEKVINKLRGLFKFFKNDEDKFDFCLVDYFEQYKTAPAVIKKGNITIFALGYCISYRNTDF